MTKIIKTMWFTHIHVDILCVNQMEFIIHWLNTEDAHFVIFTGASSVVLAQKGKVAVSQLIGQLRKISRLSFLQPLKLMYRSAFSFSFLDFWLENGRFAF